jgi:hypothetical protein
MNAVTYIISWNPKMQYVSVASVPGFSVSLQKHKMTNQDLVMLIVERMIILL